MDRGILTAYNGGGLKSIAAIGPPGGRCKMDIKRIRAMTGLSQSKFAERYSIPVKTLQNWEINRRQVPVYLLKLLERVVKEDTKTE